MKRCLLFFRSVRVVMMWSAAGMVALATAASAQMAVRQFPAAVQRGMMTVTAPPEITINGIVARLSPGVRIRGPNNMFLMSGALIGQQFAVNYLTEPQGMVREVWILNQAEVDALPRGWDIVTNIRFASDADKPKVDDGKTPFDQLPKFPKQ
ncbi:MAG: hypothetical protein ABIR55_04110 [Burkholderiaceae bacterium]